MMIFERAFPDNILIFRHRHNNRATVPCGVSPQRRAFLAIGAAAVSFAIYINFPYLIPSGGEA